MHPSSLILIRRDSYHFHKDETASVILNSTSSKSPSTLYKSVLTGKLIGCSRLLPSRPIELFEFCIKKIQSKILIIRQIDLFYKRVWIERHFYGSLYAMFDRVALELPSLCSTFENSSKCSKTSFDSDSFLE